MSKKCHLFKLFQSSPTPEGGRYPQARAHILVVNTFQSSPTPEGGRYHVQPQFHWVV
uniref:Uncharacterized protein n=1 Tax=mine drainage metagenome TaxID=410659 RepID=E6QQF6_9ZZZZ